MALLTNRTWDVEGTWYAPQKFLTDEFAGVVRAELWNTCSSAGDWDGYFVQKHGGRYYLIRFWQENIHWTRCFRITTAYRAFAHFSHEPAKHECDAVLDAHEQERMRRMGSYR